MKITLLFIFSVLFLACYSSILPHNGNPVFPSEREDRDEVVGQPVKKYKVYPNTSYQDKWKPVFEDNMESFKTFMLYFKHRLIKYDLITEESYEFIQNSGDFYDIYDQDFVDEIQSISDLTGNSFNQIFALNMIYEIVAYRKSQENLGMCSAILAYSSDGEEILHAKNLDFIFPDLIGKNLIQFDYYDPETDQLIYSTSSLIGTVWANSFIRYGAYSVSLNERNTGMSLANIVDYILGAKVTHQSLMNLLQTVDNYKDFVAQFQETKTVAGCYLTVASFNAKEGGMLIQKSRTCQNNEIVKLTYKNWFIAQTNHDLGTPDPDNRSTQLTELLLAMGRKNISKQSLFGILQFFPNFNYHTIHTTMMNIQKGEFETTNWWA